MEKGSVWKMSEKEEKTRLYTWKWILGNENYPSAKGAITIYFLACDGCRIIEDENAKETRIYIGSEENREKRRKQVDDLKKKYNYMNTKEDTKQYQIAFIKQLKLNHFYFGRLKERQRDNEKPMKLTFTEANQLFDDIFNRAVQWEIAIDGEHRELKGIDMMEDWMNYGIHHDEAAKIFNDKNTGWKVVRVFNDKYGNEKTIDYFKNNPDCDECTISVEEVN